MYRPCLFVLAALLASPCPAQGTSRLVDAQAYTLPSELQPSKTKSVQRYNNTLEQVLASAARVGIGVTVVMPNPQPVNEANPHDAEVLAREFKRYQDRVAILGGGGSLNRILQRAVVTDSLDADEQAFFQRRARELLAAGARGFGEIALDKFAHGVDGTQYQHAPADHPFMLLLADIAAARDVPIVVHMEPIARDMPRPERLDASRHPDILRANLVAFERLLDHNPQARILWAHLGNDTLPGRTPKLLDDLLARHPNLYLGLTGPARKPGKPWATTTESGRLKPDWAELVAAYPQRFLLASGYFYMPEAAKIHLDYHRGAPQPQPDDLPGLLAGLPEAIARDVGAGNAARLFKLPQTR